MPTYLCEMRSTQDWNSCHYRTYTRSKQTAEEFKSIPKIQFTDNGHGIVPYVREMEPGERRIHNIMTCAEHVTRHLRAKKREREKRKANLGKFPFFLAFAGPRYYAEGGWNDLVGSFGSYEDAIDGIKNSLVAKDRDGKSNDSWWWHVVDNTGKIVAENNIDKGAAQELK